VTAFVAFDATSSIVVYFVKTYLGRGDEVSFVLGTLLVAQVVSLPFYERLSRRTSKPRSYIVGALMFVAVMALSFLITPQTPGFLLYGFAALVGLGSGGVVMMVYAIFPDIPDVDELKTGERREGIYAALTTFTRKLSSALAVFLVAQTLELTGYVPPVEQAGQLIEQPQSAGFLLALRLVFVLLPVVFIVFGVLMARRFPLTVGRYQQLEAVLHAQRRGALTDAQEQARRVLLEELA
jgi:GPH family glycoside/pentoside/hexuronide:cation symporter